MREFLAWGFLGEDRSGPLFYRVCELYSRKSAGDSEQNPRKNPRQNPPKNLLKRMPNNPPENPPKNPPEIRQKIRRKSATKSAIETLVAFWPTILRFAAAWAALILRLRPAGLRFGMFIKKALLESFSAVNTLFTKSEFVCDSSAIRLRVGCGHKHPCVFFMDARKGDF